MNETIKNIRIVDHGRTEKILKEILQYVKKQSAAYMRYQEAMDDSKDQAMYSAQYLKGFADEALEALVKIGKDNVSDFERLINTMIEVESANDEALFDLKDNVLKNAVDMIDILGDKMGYQTCIDIIKHFVGQRRNLDVIKNTMEVKCVSIPTAASKYFYDSNKIFEELEVKLIDCALSPLNISHYGSVLKSVKNIAVVLGIELTDSELEIDIPTDAINDSNMRAVMGL